MTRVIAIGGPPYCGSTLLDRCLGRLPGVVGLGETRWILDDPAEPWGRCGQHGAECETFTPAALADLRAGEEATWWPRLAAVVGAPAALVSSDKEARHFRRLGLPDAVVLPYRNAASMLASHQRQDGRWVAGLGLPAEALRCWRDWLSLGIPWLALDTDELAVDPESRLRSLAAGLSLEWSKDALAPWDSEACVFGGNVARLHGFGRRFLRGSGWSGTIEVDASAFRLAVRDMDDIRCDLLGGPPSLGL